MEKKRFSVIGCEHAHIEIFIQEMLALGYACAGIYEPVNVKLAETFSSKYGIPLVSDQALLLADDVEVVGSAAINNEKIDLIEQCERLGKAVMIDKPAATNRRDYERLRGVVERGKIQVGMLLTERFHPAIYTLKRLIDQGELGRLVSIGMRKPHKLNPELRPQWFFSKTQCGGIIVDLLIHDYDLLRWLTGSEIQRSQGVMVKSVMPEHPDFYNAASMEVMMRSGLIAQLYADWHTPVQSWTWGDGRIFATGTQGFAELRLSGDPLISSESLLLRTTNSDSLSSIPLENPPISLSQDFLNRIRGLPAVITGQDILAATLATIDADETAQLVHCVE